MHRTTASRVRDPSFALAISDEGRKDPGWWAESVNPPWALPLPLPTLSITAELAALTESVVARLASRVRDDALLSVSSTAFPVLRPAFLLSLLDASFLLLLLVLPFRSLASFCFLVVALPLLPDFFWSLLSAATAGEARSPGADALMVPSSSSSLSRDREGEREEK